MNTDRVSQLVLNEYQTFGKKTFWIFISKWLETPTVFLVIAFVLSFTRRTSLVPVDYQTLVAWGSLVCFGLAIISGIIALFIARFVYKTQGFCISPDSFKMRSGIFVKQETAIPYRQIQNVSTERGIIQQMWGVSKIVIVTAGQDDQKTDHNESKAVIQSIDKELAVELQDELLRRADVERVINTSK